MSRKKHAQQTAELAEAIQLLQLHGYEALAAALEGLTISRVRDLNAGYREGRRTVWKEIRELADEGIAASAEK